MAALNWSDTIYPNLGYPRQKRRKWTFLHEEWSESTLSISAVPETDVENSWNVNDVLVLISQVAALNWSDTIHPNLEYPVKNAENRHFCTKCELKVLYSLVMFLKLMLRIVEVYSNVWALISQVAALNWSDTIYPYLGYPRQKRRKWTFLHEEWSESTLSISDVPETYVENSWGVKQRFGINQPSGRAQLKWHHTPKLRVPPSKTPKIDIFARRVNWKYFIH